MTLDVPDYVKAAKAQDPKIRYKWDDWNEEQALEPVDKDLLARLKALSQRAAIAFTAATGEWVVYRFEELTDVTVPLQFLEMAWANIVDFNYVAMTWQDYEDAPEWVGPVKRPVAIAMEKVDNAFQAVIGDGRPELRGAWITNLAQYVLTDPAPYVKWRERAMVRLESLYPCDPNDRLGDVVPREALDPDFNFDVEDTERLINEFLARLDHRSNPFLNSPESMLEQGYTGLRYRFDIEADRRLRREAI